MIIPGRDPPCGFASGAGDGSLNPWMEGGVVEMSVTEGDLNLRHPRHPHQVAPDHHSGTRESDEGRRILRTTATGALSSRNFPPGGDPRPCRATRYVAAK